MRITKRIYSIGNTQKYPPKITTKYIFFLPKNFGSPNHQRGLKRYIVQSPKTFNVFWRLSLLCRQMCRDKHSLVNSPKAATLRKGDFLRVTCTPSIIILLLSFILGWTWKCSNWKLEDWVPGCSFVGFIAFSLDVGWLSFASEQRTSSCIRLYGPDGLFDISAPAG